MIGKWKLMLTAIVLVIITVLGTKHSALQLQALDRAMVDAQSRADELAKSSGVQRGEVLSMSEVISSGPGPRAGSMVAQVESLAVPIQPGSSEVQAQVQVVYAIQSSGP